MPFQRWREYDDWTEWFGDERRVHRHRLLSPVGNQIAQLGLTPANVLTYHRFAQLQHLLNLGSTGRDARAVLDHRDDAGADLWFDPYDDLGSSVVRAGMRSRPIVLPTPGNPPSELQPSIPAQPIPGKRAERLLTLMRRGKFAAWNNQPRTGAVASTLAVWLGRMGHTHTPISLSMWLTGKGVLQSGKRVFACFATRDLDPPHDVSYLKIEVTPSGPSTSISAIGTAAWGFNSGTVSIGSAADYPGETDDWHHVLWQIESSEMVLWLNGIKIGRVAYTPPAQDRTGDIYLLPLGLLASDNSVLIDDCTVDDVLVYSGKARASDSNFASALERHVQAVHYSSVRDTLKTGSSIARARALFSGGTVEISVRASDTRFSRSNQYVAWSAWTALSNGVFASLGAVVGRYWQARIRLTPSGTRKSNPVEVTDLQVDWNQSTALAASENIGDVPHQPDRFTPIDSTQGTAGIRVQGDAYRLRFGRSTTALVSFTATWTSLSTAQKGDLTAFLDQAGQLALWNVQPISYDTALQVRSVEQYELQQVAPNVWNVSVAVREVR